jgi:hypothetical protein
MMFNSKTSNTDQIVVSNTFRGKNRFDYRAYIQRFKAQKQVRIVAGY